MDDEDDDGGLAAEVDADLEVDMEVVTEVPEKELLEPLIVVTDDMSEDE